MYKAITEETSLPSIHASIALARSDYTLHNNDNLYFTINGSNKKAT